MPFRSRSSGCDAFHGCIHGPTHSGGNPEVTPQEEAEPKQQVRLRDRGPGYHRQAPDTDELRWRCKADGKAVRRWRIVLLGTYTMFPTTVSLVLSFMLGGMFALPASAQEILPFPLKPSGSIAERTMQESTYSPLPPVTHLPKDAPNILIVLIDDVGPAQTDTFGGEVHTPTLSRMAKEGIAYNRFHTTAMCSPTRAALLTGRNHHRVASGQITELGNDWDGYMGIIPKSSATVAEVLKEAMSR